jgi:hypothetical protein
VNEMESGNWEGKFQQALVFADKMN